MLRPIAIVAALLVAFPVLAETIQVPKGKVSVVTPGFLITTVAVGDASVADAQVDGDKNVVIFGKKAGDTAIVVFDQDHNPVYSAQVHVTLGKIPDGMVIIHGPAVPDTVWSCDDDRTCIKIP